jgi:pyrroloquinoline quinone (PQQ) biosynthesis protein C
MPTNYDVVPFDPRWNHLIDPSWIDELDATPFLTRCREGTATRSELYGFVRQQYYYSRHFTRYLCALMAQITIEEDRVELVKNLFEEMGLGEFGNTPHAAIYREMMSAMHVRLTQEAEHPATTELVQLMFETCQSQQPLAGLAALGLGAEAIVPHVYSQILRGFSAIGEPDERLTFFTIHVEGDDEHAVTMRNIIERELAHDPHKRPIVRAAARRVISARTRFFRAMARPAAVAGQETCNASV